MNKTGAPASPTSPPADLGIAPADHWVSVVIPIHSCRATIRQALEGLHRQKVPARCEIVFVHDFIKDDTLEIIKSHPIAREWDFLEIKDHPGRGLAKAYNLGWRAARSAHVLFMHPDCYPVADDALLSMMQGLEWNSAVAAKPLVGIPQDDWAAMSFWDKVTSSQYCHAKPDHNLVGKFDLYRREVLAELGGFDEVHFFSAAEDADMNERLLAIGKISAVDTLVIHAHQHPPNARFKSVLRKHAQVGEGNGAMFRKYWHSTNFLRRAWTIVGVNLLKLVLLVGIFIPPVSLYALALMLLLAAYYGRWAMLSRDWRVVLVPFAVALMFAVNAVAMVRGFVLGRQSFHYAKRTKS